MQRMAMLALVVAAAVAVHATARPGFIRPHPDSWSRAERAALPDWCSASPTRALHAPECGGFIGGIVWAGTPSNCSYVLLDNETDKTRVVDAVDVCNDHRSAAPAAASRARRGYHHRRQPAAAAMEGFTAFDNPTKQILYVTGDGSYVYGVSVGGNGFKTVARLPATYAPLVGLAVANGVGDAGSWYVVTTDALLQVDAATQTTREVLALDVLGLSAATRVTAFNTTLYLKDGLRVHTVDLAAVASGHTDPAPVTSTTIGDASLATAQTVTYWWTNNTLVTVSASRVVTQIDLTSGGSWPLLTLPAGSGAVDRATSFFDMYFVTDASHMYLVNLAARALETTALWPGANTKSNIQYYY